MTTNQLVYPKTEVCLVCLNGAHPSSQASKGASWAHLPMLESVLGVILKVM
jgi:hypothetical protein